MDESSNCLLIYYEGLAQYLVAGSIHIHCPVATFIFGDFVDFMAVFGGVKMDYSTISTATSNDLHSTYELSHP